MAWSAVEIQFVRVSQFPMRQGGGGVRYFLNDASSQHE